MVWMMPFANETIMETKKPLKFKVTCVITEATEGDGQRITQIGGDGWQKKLSDVLYEIGLGTSCFYTFVDGERAEVHKVSPDQGDPYIRTDKDDETTNNLLKLPRCPKPLP